MCKLGTNGYLPSKEKEHGSATRTSNGRFQWRRVPRKKNLYAKGSNFDKAKSKLQKEQRRLDGCWEMISIEREGGSGDKVSLKGRVKFDPEGTREMIEERQRKIKDIEKDIEELRSDLEENDGGPEGWDLELETNNKKQFLYHCEEGLHMLKSTIEAYERNK